MACQQAAGLREAGYRVEVLTTVEANLDSSASRIIDQSAPVEQWKRRSIPWLGLNGIFSLGLLYSLWARLRSSRDTVVHVHASRDLICFPAIILCLLSRTPYVTQSHGMIVPCNSAPERLFDRLITRVLLRHASANLVLQEEELAAIAQVSGTRRRLKVVPNGVEIKEEQSWRDPCDPVVLFLAHLRENKRVSAFLEMAQILAGRGVVARFVVAGPDGGDAEKVLSAIDRWPLLGRLTYLGAVSHARALELTSMCSVYVLPSQYDPFPMSLLEALALGTPSVCTNRCGIASILIAKEAAVVTLPDAEYLADAVEALLQDPTRREALSVRARRFVGEDLSMEATVRELMSCYQHASQNWH